MHRLIAIATLLAISGNCFADEWDLTTDELKKSAEEDKPLWELKLAGFARYGPAYPASEDSQVDIIPLPFPVYRGKILRLSDDDTDKPVRTRIFRRDRVKLDIDFGFNFAAKSEDIDAREGMDDLDPLVEAGPELEFQFAQAPYDGEMFLALQAGAATSFDGLSTSWRGMIYTSELRYQKLFQKTELTLKLQPEWANTPYMNYYYGVNPDDVTPDREEFDASGGYLGTKVGFSLKREFSENLDFVTGFRFGYYKGAKNEDSPLFTSDTNTSVFIAVLWKFWESDTREFQAPVLSPLDKGNQ